MAIHQEMMPCSLQLIILTESEYMGLKKGIESVMYSGNRVAEGMRFVLTGGIAALIQYVCYILLLWCGITVEVSTVISYCVSLVFNYIMSNRFTFRTRLSRRNAVLFACCHMVNLGMQTILAAFFSHLIDSEIALLPAMVICVPCNFFMVRYVLKSCR